MTRAALAAGARGRRLHGHVGRGEAVHAPPGAAVHDLDAAAGGEPQAAPQLAADDARRPAPLRERLHHLHAHRLDDAVRLGAHRSAVRRLSSSTAPTRSRPSRGATSGGSRMRRRPTRRSARRATASRRPTRCAAQLSGEELNLYELIWKRTVASQMADARGQTVSVRIGSTAADGRPVEFAHSGHRDHVPRLPARLRGRPRRAGDRCGGEAAAAPAGGPVADGDGARARTGTRRRRRRASPRRRS